MTNSYLRDAVRRRAARRGISYQRALQDLTRYDSPRVGAPRNPGDIDWSPLIGIEVALRDDHHDLRGVVLPPDGVHPGKDLLRVAVTAPHTGPAPATVTYIDARWWSIDPMPDRVDQRYRPSRRRVRSEAGLPIHRAGELPVSALATKSMLKRQYRLRPAEEQTPVALYYSGRDYAPLFVIDDAVPLRALSPGRQAAWESVRTCARCGCRGGDPFGECPDGKRYCRSCDPLAADEAWTRGLQAAQRAAIGWAAGVLADPKAVITACEITGPTDRLVVLDVVTGTVVHDLTIAIDHPREPGDEAALRKCTPAADIAEAFAALRARRLIGGSSSGPIVFVRRLARAGILDRATVGGVEAWGISSGDELSRWYGYWLSQPEFDQQRTETKWSRWWYSPLTLRGMRHTSTTDEVSDPVTRCRKDLALLREIAAGLPSAEHADTARRQGRSAGSSVYVYQRDLQAIRQKGRAEVVSGDA